MIDNTYDACAWGSHLPSLLACLADTVGPVLEIGIGHFSTPALHAFCVSAQRKLVSVETNLDWMKEFRGDMAHQYHEFHSWNPVPVKGWSVVFIDDSPGGDHRANEFRDYLDKSVFVVVHDYHRENEEAIKPLLDGVRYHVTTTYQPPTLVASKVREIPKSILCL